MVEHGVRGDQVRLMFSPKELGEIRDRLDKLERIEQLLAELVEIERARP